MSKRKYNERRKQRNNKGLWKPIDQLLMEENMKNNEEQWHVMKGEEMWRRRESNLEEWMEENVSRRKKWRRKRRRIRLEWPEWRREWRERNTGGREKPAEKFCFFSITEESGEWERECNDWRENEDLEELYEGCVSRSWRGRPVYLWPDGLWEGNGRLMQRNGSVT